MSSKRKATRAAKGDAPQRRLTAHRSLLTSTAGDNWNRIYAVVRRVPKGRVATYGQIATLAGLRNHARQVGYALHALPTGSGVPWHRVINAQGKVSGRAEPGYVLVQQKLLESEGIEIGVGDRISLKRFGWKPR